MSKTNPDAPWLVQFHAEEPTDRRWLNPEDAESLETEVMTRDFVDAILNEDFDAESDERETTTTVPSEPTVKNPTKSSFVGLILIMVVIVVFISMLLVL